MSFSHFSLDSNPHSTQIKGDFLHSLLLLDNMAMELDEYAKADDTTKSDPNKFSLIRKRSNKLEQVIKVYNENITHINKECTNFKELERPTTFDAYREAYGCSRKEEVVRNEYECDLIVKENSYRNRLSECINLCQIGLLFPQLSKKIEMVIQRALDQKLSLEKLPELIPLTESEVKRRLSFHSCLRQPNDIVDQKEDASSPSSTSSTSSTSVVASQPAIQKPEWIPADIECSTDKVLGLCHEPSWGEKPALFTLSSSDRNKWQGQIPIDKDFKFVLIEDSKIVKWEEGSNRRFNETSSQAQNPPLFY